MNSDTEFAEEYTNTERLWLIGKYLVLGGAAVAASERWLFPSIAKFSATAPCHSLFGINGVTILWHALFVGIPVLSAFLVFAVFGWRGYKILRDKQVPPLGEKVLRPTRIRRGPTATLAGYAHICAFLPFVAIAVWGAGQAQHLIEISHSQQVRKSCTANNHIEPTTYPSAALRYASGQAAAHVERWAPK